MKNTARLLLVWAVTSIAGADSPSPAPAPKAGLEETVAAIRHLRQPPNDTFTPRAIEDSAKRRLLYRLDRGQLGNAARQLVGKNNEHQGLDFALLMEWMRLNPKEIFDYLRGFDEQWFDCVLGNELFERWAASDPDAALAAAKSIQNKERIYDVLAMIAVDSPARALESMPPVQSPQYGFARDVLAYWTGTDLAAATQWVLKQPKRDNLMWNLAYVRAEVDRGQTQKWALSLNGDDRIHALAGMISESLAERKDKSVDVERPSADFLEFFADSGLNQDNMANQAEKFLADSICNAWSKTGRPADGLKWVHQLKPSEGRDEIHAQLVAKWSEKNPAGALKYLSGLGAGRELDRALGYSATNLSRVDPAMVFRLLQSSGRNDWRHTALVQCFRLWLQVAPRDAVSALDSLPKEEAMKIESAISESAKSPPRRTF